MILINIQVFYLMDLVPGVKHRMNH